MSLPPPVSSRHQAAVHGDGGGRGATAEQQQPPGLGTERCPRFRPSEATPDMAEGGDSVGEKGEGEERDDPLVLVFALAAPALPAVVSRLDVAVPRKARSCLPRAVPSTWWSCRIPVLLPQPAKDPAEEEEEQGRMFPGPQRLSATPLPYPAAPAAKRARRCLHCDAAETPRWRPGPMGQGTLCNACGVWYSTTGALPEHRPPASPITDLLPERPIWEPEVPGAIYLVRKSEDQRRPPRTEAAQAQRPRTTCLNCGSPEAPKWREGPMGLREVCNACGVRYKKGRLLPECRPAASQMADSPPESPIADSPPESPIWKPDPRPAVYLARKPAKQRKTPTTRMEVASAPGKKKKKNRTCVHCGSSETPQWREGPMGRGTLCNACGVRYKQGRLLPEYRPMASPTFVPSEHANSHRRVLELHRKRQGKEQYPPPPLSLTFVPSKLANNRRHVPKLRKKRKCRDQNLRTSPPVDSLINPGTTCEDHPIDTPCFPSDHPANTLGCVNVLVDAPSSLDSILLEGPSAPLIVESDEFVVS